MRPPGLVFVDTGAWIALAIVRDALHPRASAAWEELRREGARLLTSVPVVVETHTYLDRKGSREVAAKWQAALVTTRGLEITPCSAADLDAAWPWMARPDLHKLSLTDATSFVIMGRRKVRRVFTFDTHFATAGFVTVG
jgi:predicted nucleic acid-binding protein